MNLEKTKWPDGKKCAAMPVSYTHLDVYKRQDPLRLKVLVGMAKNKQEVH